jgi:HEAT repeat protein
MKEGIAAVEIAMNDQAAQVRLAAVWSLYQLAGAECAPTLIRTFSDEDGEVRRRAITCITWLAREKKKAGMAGISDSKPAASALIRCLQDPARSVRIAALAALEAVTETRMSKQPATDDNDSHQEIIEQLEKWWRQELLG